MIRCLAVLREITHSPNRESDDALILKSVVAELDEYGFETRLVTPEEFDSEEPGRFDVIIPMCESYNRLKRLDDLTAMVPLIVNRAESVLNCYRTSMVPLLSHAPQVCFPPSEILRVEGAFPEQPTSFDAPEGWWIKRGDVHNTCNRDVVRIAQWEDLRKVLNDFRSREITRFIAQPHLSGDLIKFYGVGPGRWFTWFYHEPDKVKSLPFDTEDLALTASHAASILGLEVFGGDAIIEENKRITIIDVNSWPSFARVRGGAAPQIARHLKSRIQHAVIGNKTLHEND